MLMLMMMLLMMMMMLSNMRAWILKFQIPGVLSRCSFLHQLYLFSRFGHVGVSIPLKRNFFPFLWFSHQLLSRRGRWCVASRVLGNSEEAVVRKNNYDGACALKPQLGCCITFGATWKLYQKWAGSISTDQKLARSLLLPAPMGTTIGVWMAQPLLFFT